MIEHIQRKEIRNSHVFDNVTDFKSMCSSIKKTANKLYSSHDQKKNEFVGAAFEVFCEYFLKTVGSDSHIGFKTIETTSQDKYYVGTDFYGTTLSDRKGQIQAKFSSNPKEQLGVDRLGGFFMRIVAEKTNLDDVLIITNVYHTKTRSGVSPAVDNTFKSQGVTLRVLGYSDLEMFTTQRVGFWDAFRQALDVSCVLQTRTELPIMWTHQIRVHDAIEKLLRSKNEDRIQVIVPTGGGKTRNEWEATRSIFAMNKAGAVVVFAPTIELLRQHFLNFNEFGDDGWRYLHVRTGKDVERKFGEDDDVDQFKTTSATDISNQVIQAKIDNVPLVILSTYASALKLKEGIAIVRQDLPRFYLDLAIADEAHRLVTDGNVGDILEVEHLPVNKWAFFTATRRFGKHRGMNIKKMFGDNIIRVLPRELINAGIIVRPRILLVHVNESSIKGMDNRLSDIGDNREEFAALYKILEYHQAIRGTKNSHMVVFNSSAELAHDFAEDELLQQLMPNWHFDAISSKLMRMKGRDRSKIFKDFIANPLSALFQHSIVKEGIDLPGITGVALLRQMDSVVDLTQAIGRAVRLTPIDRAAFLAGKIKAGDDAGWDKPTADVFVMISARTTSEFKAELQQVVRNIRGGGYDKEDVEIYVPTPVHTGGEKDVDPDLELYGVHRQRQEFFPDVTLLDELCDQVWIEQEEEEKLDIAFEKDDVRDFVTALLDVT